MFWKGSLTGCWNLCLQVGALTPVQLNSGHLLTCPAWLSEACFPHPGTLGSFPLLTPAAALHLRQSRGQDMGGVCIIVASPRPWQGPGWVHRQGNVWTYNTRHLRVGHDGGCPCPRLTAPLCIWCEPLTHMQVRF